MDLTDRKSHFEFGQNWKDYATTIDQNRIESAIEGLRKLFSDGLAGKTLLDIGCGSGLHSLAALSLGARRCHVPRRKYWPDFGAKLLVESARPSGRGYVVWPALNLIACAGLYLLARHERFNRTIVAAAFAALILQALAMEADKWWPAIFGDPNGRAGGLAQNANMAALLVIVLASLTLPVILGDRLNRFAFYAVMIAAAAVLFSQSRTGGICLVVYIACFGFAARNSEIRWPHPAFIVGFVTAIAGTIWFSPVLNPTPHQIEKSRELAVATKNNKTSSLPHANLDSPIPLTERIEFEGFD